MTWKIKLHKSTHRIPYACSVCDRVEVHVQCVEYGSHDAGSFMVCAPCAAELVVRLSKALLGDAATVMPLSRRHAVMLLREREVATLTHRIVDPLNHGSADRIMQRLNHALRRLERTADRFVANVGEAPTWQ